MTQLMPHALVESNAYGTEMTGRPIGASGQGQSSQVANRNVQRGSNANNRSQIVGGAKQSQSNPPP